MTKFITLLIGASLTLAAGAQAKPAEQKNKKSKPAPQQQVAPAPKHQPKAPKPQAQAMPKYKNPSLQNNAKIHHNNAIVKQQPKAPKESAETMKKSWKDASTTPEGVKRHSREVQPNTLPAVQSDNLKANKIAKTFHPKHQNFRARVNPSVASVQYNQNFRIRNAENWSGSHYNVYRTYRPQWHDRSWWSSHHSHLTLIGGGWYFWNAGYWYPAWGYDTSAAYYPYDGPIYVGSHPRPFDQVVADVQSILQEQGYYRGEVDGLVGPLTQQALAAYQSAQGLAPTAAIDRPTLESLGIS